MKTAADYPMGFGYGAKDGYYYGPNGIVGPYHRGNDIFAPVGTPVVVNGVTIGKVGDTGVAEGPHTHVQRMKNDKDVNPTGYEWSLDGAVVVETGKTPVEGKYVKIQDKSGAINIYMHLSEINVNKGDKLVKEKFVIEEQRPVFRADYYLKQHPDVAKQYTLKTAVQHWKKYGIKEGRASAPNFHVKEYLANYPDLRKAYGDKGYAKAVQHYFQFGINEGRSGRKRNPVVNTAQATLDKIKELLK